MSRGPNEQMAVDAGGSLRLCAMARALDISPSGTDVLDLRESEFRRGYWDGYVAAMHALRSTCRERAWQRVDGFVEDELMPWACGDCTEIVDPPTCPAAEGAE